MIVHKDQSKNSDSSGILHPSYVLQAYEACPAASDDCNIAKKGNQQLELGTKPYQRELPEDQKAKSSQKPAHFIYSLPHQYPDSFDKYLPNLYFSSLFLRVGASVTSVFCFCGRSIWTRIHVTCHGKYKNTKVKFADLLVSEPSTQGPQTPNLSLALCLQPNVDP